MMHFLLHENPHETTKSLAPIPTLSPSFPIGHDSLHAVFFFITQGRFISSLRIECRTLAKFISDSVNELFYMLTPK